MIFYIREYVRMHTQFVDLTRGEVLNRYYYSKQVRERVCHLYFDENYTQAQIAEAFGHRPCERTVHAIIQSYVANGDVLPLRGQTGTRKPCKFDEIAAQTLVELVQADDQALLSDLATAMTNLLGTLWSGPDISRALSELGYVRKKVLTRAFEARESAQLAYRELV
ncbi:hypothetical protein VOLCADRAFT_106409 [Volvox carteri f. nagariensis]|uniref:Uncharacterized protein n=1 Tax=Volvox carteri f. nagariensis TaxID=3068 RepID=D8U763_VOLCA|nr:uncharacterized protein VOLCADRAFT_106409 [Volvox carteri f. nagariensis]EFJ44369.1 hypothetical protein VOLCADRAFT_106409 [Volvox carteri f. nagariensis]|eukprot:XP_002954476.1 hypothetical protein VOLCADRAFT_106409 [Volvox carteri f. nagariensis]